MQTVQAEQADAPITPITTDPSIKIGKLSNGLSYYIKSNAVPKNQVEIRLAVKYGSIDEAESERGAAHFIEHLVFRNSQQFKSDSLVPMFGRLGLKIGENLNGTTHHEKTVYTLSLPSNKDQQVKMALQGLAAMAGGARFLSKDVEGEMSIIDQEQQLRENYSYRSSEAMLDFQLRGTPHAHRMPIGVKEIRRTFTAPMLQKLYDQHYRANRMAVVVVGNIDAAAVLRQIEAQFSSIARSEHPYQRPPSDLPVHEKAELKVISDPEQMNHEIQIPFSIRTLQISRNNRDLEKEWTRRIYFKLMNQRLHGGVVYKTALLNEIEWVNDFEAVNLYLKLDSNAVNAIEKANLTIQQVIDKGFLAEELDDARQDFLTHYEQAYRERDKLGSDFYAEAALNHFLYGSKLWSPEQRYQMVTKALQAIQLSGLNQFAKQVRLDPSNAQILYWVPANAKESLPSLSQLLGAFKISSTGALPDYKPSERLKSPIKTPPARPGTIVSETYNTKLGAYEWLLSNGVVVVLKKTNLAADRVIMLHEQAGGTAWVADQDVVTANLSSMLTDTMGFDQISPRLLQRYQASKGLSYGLNVNFHGRQIYGESATANVLDLLQINYQRITNSSREVGLFKIGQTNLKQNLMSANQNTDQVIADQLRRLIFRDDPRTIYLPPIRDIETLNVDKVISTFEGMNKDFNGSYFVFVGNLDFDDLRIQLPKYLANLPSKERDITLKRAYPEFAQGVVERTIFLGNEDKSLLSVVFLNEVQTRQDIDRLHVDLLNQILYQRVWKKLREQQALIYSFEITNAYYNSGRGLAAMMFLPGASDKLDHIEKAFFSEIEQLQTKLVAIEELVEAKKKILNTHREAMQKNYYIANKLLEIELRRSAGEMYLEPEKLLAKATEASLRQAAQKFYDLKHLVKLKKLPAAMATGPQAEMERYRTQVPRDLGAEAIRALRNDSWSIFRDIVDSTVAEKAPGLYLNTATRLLQLEEIGKRAGKVEVGACLETAKQSQLEFVLVARELIKSVSGDGDTGKKVGDAISVQDRNEIWRKTTPVLDALGRIAKTLEQCADGNL
ncbi:insulinase family protein [Undibacterium cyanobacteriorum]|uniref:Insulinase family protein n=1 Tax=Undibacterium cyanobacteriorum TaxID=3073561 RepID=A0ABY9RGG2_9BURK|nr:insulinase family protein [Undibacterium sp. 20NA77.5]WMW80309.1 insulinase family protein [Undibacterium sp. 20NA77.5]